MERAEDEEEVGEDEDVEEEEEEEVEEEESDAFSTRKLLNSVESIRDLLIFIVTEIFHQFA